MWPGWAGNADDASVQNGRGLAAVLRGCLPIHAQPSQAASHPSNSRVEPGHHTPTSPAVPQVPLPHTAARQPSHLVSLPLQLRLRSRRAPVPGP